MIKRNLPRLLIVALLSLILISVVNAVAAGNIVPTTRLDDQRFSITANSLAPAACSGLNLTNIVISSGLIFGTASNDLILDDGGGGDLIFGLGGDDCIIGGGGNDTIYGGAGNDVCIGGPGTDSFPSVLGNGCETQIQ